MILQERGILIPTNDSLVVPDPSVNPEAEARAFYTRYYQIERDDSPQASRESLIKRAHPAISSLPSTGIVIDIGAGKQVLEEEYIIRHGEPACQIVTVDIADVQRSQLAAGDSSRVTHIQASGRALPFPDGIFGAAVSNLAFDFMPPEAYGELYRVMQHDSRLFLNLHHPSLIPPNVDEIIRAVQRRIYNKQRFGRERGLNKDFLVLASLRHKLYLERNKMLFDSGDAIRSAFENAGFTIQRADLAKDKRGDRWWEVDMARR